MAQRTWLERKIKRVITAGERRSFIFDSHPRICRLCLQLRYLLRNRRNPKIIIIYTKHGVYVWRKQPGENPALTLFLKRLRKKVERK